MGAKGKSHLFKAFLGLGSDLSWQIGLCLIEGMIYCCINSKKQTPCHRQTQIILPHHIFKDL
jgi:hypothetical protein